MFETLYIPVYGVVPYGVVGVEVAVSVGGVEEASTTMILNGLITFTVRVA